MLQNFTETSFHRRIYSHNAPSSPAKVRPCKCETLQAWQTENRFYTQVVCYSHLVIFTEQISTKRAFAQAATGAPGFTNLQLKLPVDKLVAALDPAPPVSTIVQEPEALGSWLREACALPTGIHFVTPWPEVVARATPQPETPDPAELEPWLDGEITAAENVAQPCPHIKSES